MTELQDELSPVVKELESKPRTPYNSKIGPLECVTRILSCMA